jgi:hypothetical protein
MKRLLLITVFISLFIIPVFPQYYNHIKIDTTYRSHSLFSNSANPNLLIGKNYNGLLNNSIIDRNWLFRDFSHKNLLFGQSSGKLIYSTYDSMPCMIPEGNFSMLILKPDSSVRYTLLIKKP